MDDELMSTWDGNLKHYEFMILIIQSYSHTVPHPLIAGLPLPVHDMMI